jgi:hypothetical protein
MNSPPGAQAPGGSAFAPSKVQMEPESRSGLLAAEEKTMSVGTIILIILIIALLGGFSGIGGGPFYGTGYYGGGGLGIVIVILLILVLMGRI